MHGSDDGADHHDEHDADRRRDAELMSGIRRGDERAFEALFQRYRDPLRARLARMLRDDAAAGDVTQEVFLRVWTRGQQFDGTGSVRAWLFRIGVNLALNHVRTVRRRRQQPLDGLADEHAAADHVPGWLIDPTALAPDAIAALADQNVLFRRMIDRLPAAKRDALRLVHEDQLNVRDAARLLGVPEGTVRSRVHYALRDLAKALEPFRDEWED